MWGFCNSSPSTSDYDYLYNCTVVQSIHEKWEGWKSIRIVSFEGAMVPGEVYHLQRCKVIALHAPLIRKFDYLLVHLLSLCTYRLPFPITLALIMSIIGFIVLFIHMRSFKIVFGKTKKLSESLENQKIYDS